MSLTVDSSVMIDTSSPMTWELREVDQEVEVVIGSQRGYSSALRLVLSEPGACEKLAKVLLDAGERLSAGT